MSFSEQKYLKERQLRESAEDMGSVSGLPVSQVVEKLLAGEKELLALGATDITFDLTWSGYEDADMELTFLIPETREEFTYRKQLEARQAKEAAEQAEKKRRDAEYARKMKALKKEYGK